MFPVGKIDSYVRNLCVPGAEMQRFICASRPFYMSINATATVGLKERKRIKEI